MGAAERLSGQRFFVDPSCLADGAVTFPTETARQLRSVLRLRPGDGVVVLDDTGMEYDVTLTAVGRQEATGAVTAQRRCPNEPALHLTLYMALLKRDNVEWVLQKGTELGVSRFVPLLTARTVVDAVRPNKRARWRRIVTEAAEQCRRGRIPALAEPVGLETAVAQRPDGIALLPWEAAAGGSIGAALADEALGAIALFIGPEGGFEEAEVAAAEAHGVQPVTLGRRILRAETAAIAAVTLVMQAVGELG